jgi:Na+/H+-translocating membrane pyrophosphatase
MRNEMFMPILLAVLALVLVAFVSAGLLLTSSQMMQFVGGVLVGLMLITGFATIALQRIDLPR